MLFRFVGTGIWHNLPDPYAKTVFIKKKMTYIVESWCLDRYAD